MFWNNKEIDKLKLEIGKLSWALDLAEDKNRELEEFYEETKTKEITRLNELVEWLTNENNNLRDAKEAARKELQSEYNNRAKATEDDYASKLRMETESFANKMELIEWQVATEIENRTKEAVWEIKLTNKELKREAEYSKELMEIYKKKFEWGKIELGADEIKWMLLSANPSGDKIIERMGQL